ncbi:MAG: hypothetical protein AB7S54_11385 [Bacteroidales bacterium]
MEIQHNFDENSFPNTRVSASSSFADRVMASIERADAPGVDHLPLGSRILSIASVVLICVSLGIMVGAGGNSLMGRAENNNDREMIRQFRDTYHLYSYRNDFMVEPKH